MQNLDPGRGSFSRDHYTCTEDVDLPLPHATCSFSSLPAQFQSQLAERAALLEERGVVGREGVGVVLECKRRAW